MEKKQPESRLVNSVRGTSEKWSQGHSANWWRERGNGHCWLDADPQRRTVIGIGEPSRPATSKALVSLMSMVIGISHNSRAKNGTVNNICHHIIRDIKVNRVHAYSNERTREFAPFLFRQFKFTAFDVRYVVRMNALKKVINAQSTDWLAEPMMTARNIFMGTLVYDVRGGATEHVVIHFIFSLDALCPIWKTLYSMRSKQRFEGLSFGVHFLRLLHR